MLSYDDIDLNAVHVNGHTQDARGNKRAAITFQGKPAAFRLPCMRCPFGANLWQDQEGSRKNIQFNSTPEVQAFFERLDTTILQSAALRSVEFFGQTLSTDALQALYTPLLRKSKDEQYPPTVRAKINIEGRRCVKCFDPGLNPRPAPEDFRGDLQPAVALSHLWFQNKAFGAILEVTACVIHEDEAPCPFSTELEIARE